MKKTVFIMILSILMSNPVGVLMIAATFATITASPTIVQAGSMIPKDGKIVITETKGLLTERKDNGDVISLNNIEGEKISQLSLVEAEKKMDSQNCEERFFSAWRYSSITHKPCKVNFEGVDCWEDAVRKLVIDLYWSSQYEGSPIAKAFAVASLISLEHETVKYFEIHELNRYDDTEFKCDIMMNVLLSIAKRRIDLIPRIKAIVDYRKYTDDEGSLETANYFIEKLKKFEKE